MTTKPKKITTIYTDGSCDPNPGSGGWAALIIKGDKRNMISGRADLSTNNRMELTAALQAIKRQKCGEMLELFTDSQYLKKGITEWMDNWKAKNWKRKGGKLANVDLWKQLSEEIDNHQISWHWVRAHAGNRYNEMVDKEARLQAQSLKKKR